MNIRIPDDVALMGMGDVPLSGNFGLDYQQFVNRFMKSARRRQKQLLI